MTAAGTRRAGQDCRCSTTAQVADKKRVLASSARFVWRNSDHYIITNVASEQHRFLRDIYGEPH